MIVLDTSVVLAFMDRRDTDHELVRTWMEELEDELVTSPLVVAELDHLVSRKGGATAAKALREDFEQGAYLVEWWPSALRETVAVAQRYESMEVGLTDASLIALAARVKTINVATLDERHFRAVRPMTDGEEAFTLLPCDRS
ncbi:MAG TPA: PIN domain-containing protein [Solirubrobacteraceae bacterium]|nr:PIN domain-containing protein [Solirubrobacteraceae bacterium]